jgi:hypothetical protein
MQLLFTFARYHADRLLFTHCRRLLEASYGGDKEIMGALTAGLMQTGSGAWNFPLFRQDEMGCMLLGDMTKFAPHGTLPRFRSLETCTTSQPLVI